VVLVASLVAAVMKVDSVAVDQAGMRVVVVTRKVAVGALGHMGFVTMLVVAEAGTEQVMLCCCCCRNSVVWEAAALAVVESP
jgi:hypothetical protein